MSRPTRRDERIDIFLQPGEYFVGGPDFVVRTLLGSCVSITLWHAPSRTGAMSHCVLPSRTGGERDALDPRYADEALQLMLAELGAAGIAPQSCRAKVFGGANMFPAHARRDAVQVGVRNGEEARRLLAAHGIPLVSESLFGVGHRQIVFDILSGDVWARQAPLEHA